MRTKRRRVSKDRLSNLPEDVLLRIISFLMNSPKDACRTSLLSRYWRPLWCMIPDLHFSYNTIDSPEEAFDSFDRFVIRVLDSRKSNALPIRKLKFDMFLHFIPISFDTHLISTWIRGAIDCHVENLEVQVTILNPIDVFVPLSVFDSDTITTLKLLCNLCFTPSPVWLPSLKTLVISNQYTYCDDVVHCLLLSCPNLEGFDLDGKYDDLEIRAPKLRKLSARFQSFDAKSRRLIIDAASLECLYLRDLVPMKYVIKNLDNVVEAKLTIMVNRLDMMCLFSIFRALVNVKSLSLCIGIRKQNHNDGFVLLNGELQHASLEGLFDRYLPQFDKLVHLKFDEICNLGLLPSFLQKSPNLETLVIERNQNADAIWAMPEEVPHCLLSHLTHFAYRGFVPGEHELKTVKYFVRNSIMLKTMTIQPSMAALRMKSYVRSKLCAQLENIPKGSKSCELIVEKEPFRSYDFDWTKQFCIAPFV